MASEGGDEDPKVVNLNVKVTTEQDICNSGENDPDGENQDENYPFSRKSELLDNKQRMMEKHENPSNLENPIKINPEDIEIEEGSGEKPNPTGDTRSGRKTGASIGTPTGVKPRSGGLDGDTPIKRYSMGSDGIKSDIAILSDKKNYPIEKVEQAEEADDGGPEDVRRKTAEFQTSD
jgi:hypothetical protein